ncbi:MAG: S41 family peptidase [Alphaproteobacteria bacterium]|nr:S41 family peptidase [Alphaproteobacteria bacterium]
MRRFIFTLLIGTFLVNPVWAADEKKEEKQEDVYLLMDLLGATFQTIRDESVEEVSYRKMVEKSINGVLTSIDPHSGFLDAEEMADMETQTKGEFGGLGLEVGWDKDMVRISAPIDDTPGAKAGLQTGDYITHIDDVSVMGTSLNDAVKKMRGKPGTKVKLGIFRQGKKPFNVTITREIIKVNPVKFETKGDIGYLRVTTFSENTGKKLKEAIEKLTKQIGKDKLRGFVLDLRNNPGGLLDEAVAVTDLFLSQGEIVSTRSRKPEDTVRFSAKTPDSTDGAPLVILINEGSASASEIVAGALQDHKRAVIAGIKSFGKGSVQTLRQIPDFGAIKITTARYYTPSGHSIQAKGITPDVEIPRGKLEEYPRLIGWSEENLDNALASEDGKKTPEKILNEEENKKDEKPKDYQLERALDLVQAIWIANQQKEKQGV